MYIEWKGQDLKVESESRPRPQSQVCFKTKILKRLQAYNKAKTSKGKSNTMPRPQRDKPKSRIDLSEASLKQAQDFLKNAVYVTSCVFLFKGMK